MKDIAILFSGQGAQYEGMGQDLCRNSAAASRIYDEASELLGYDLLELDAASLADTRYTQLATFTLSMAAFAALSEKLASEASNRDFGRTVMAGFSLGEYSALCAADVIDFRTALELIAYRSKVMAEAAAAGVGAMYAILGLEDNVILSELALPPFLHQVFPANYNSPGQLVIAGHADACEAAAARFLELGAKRAVKLNVSGAFHTELMQTAAASLSAFAENLSFKPAKQLLFSNVSGDEMGSVASMPEYLATHMTSPVRWTDTILRLRERGVKRYIELGPGKTLIGLAKRVDRQALFLNIEDDKSLNAAVEALLR